MRNHKPISQYKIILVVALVLCTTRIGLGNIFTGASDITPANVLAAVNKERTDRNIPALNTNVKLSRAAQIKADDMIARKYFAHVNPDGHYIWDTIAAQGYTPYTILGENLAINFSDTNSLVAAWIDSPTHRENMLNSAFQDQGMGVQFGNTDNGEYSVAIANTFGTLAPQSAARGTTTPGSRQTVNAPKGIPPSITASAKITISNTEKNLNTNAVTIFGTAPADSAINVHDLLIQNGKTLADEIKSASSDKNGNFVLKFENLKDGSHSFVADSAINGKKIQSNAYSAQISYSAPEIKAETFKITPINTGNSLIVRIEGQVAGQNILVNASMLDKTAALQYSNGVYSGDLSFDEHQDLTGQTVAVTVQDQSGNKIQSSFPFSAVAEPTQQQNQAGSPDLYDIFKFAVIGFGILFILFVITDLLFSSKTRIDSIDAASHSHFVLLFLVCSTLLLVSWWH